MIFFEFLFFVIVFPGEGGINRSEGGLQTPPAEGGGGEGGGFWHSCVCAVERWTEGCCIRGRRLGEVVVLLVATTRSKCIEWRIVCW